MRRDPSAIIDDLVFAQNIDTNEKEIISILQMIQAFDPPGGARNLQECLLIQIKAKIKIESKKVKLKILKLSEIVLQNYFEEFTKKHYTKMQRSLGISESQLKAAIDEILKLNLNHHPDMLIRFLLTL